MPRRITRRCSSRSGVWTRQRDWAGCAITLLLSYMYFGARMAQSDAQASRLVEAERSHVMRMQQESDALQMQLGKLEKGNARLWRVVCRSAATVRRMSRRQSRLLHSLMRLRHRSASLASEVESLKNFLAQLNQRVLVMQCGGSVALGCLAGCMYLRLCDNLRGSAGSGGGVTNTNGIHNSVGANGSAVCNVAATTVMRRHGGWRATLSHVRGKSLLFSFSFFLWGSVAPNYCT
ncbi:hypothetical protein TcBrA4_0065790 [Trypanosoma cruzi]|nr:hypothetical protein TcBrA4_0065790 [Trypanosoma cruzi]